MERHQHVVVNFVSHLGQVWVYASHKPELLITSMVVSVGNVPPLGTKQYPLPLIASKKFLVSTWNNRSVVSIFVIFRGSFGRFYTWTGFSRHFMWIIQIWTTWTCSSSYKLVEKTNLCPWVPYACLGPMQEMGMNFKHQRTIDCRQTLRCLVFKF